VRVGVALALLLSSSSCFLSTYEHALSASGSATLAWTIEGKAEPEACGARGAQYVHIVVRKDSDGPVGDSRASCDAFAFRFVLEPGTYTASLTFESTEGTARSETATISAFAVGARRDTWITVDFSTSNAPASF